MQMYYLTEYKIDGMKTKIKHQVLIGWNDLNNMVRSRKVSIMLDHKEMTVSVWYYSLGVPHNVPIVRGSRNLVRNSILLGLICSKHM